MSRIVLSGYYGFGNAGDEAVLAAILASLRRQMPEVECGVLSVDPPATTRLRVSCPWPNAPKPSRGTISLREFHTMPNGQAYTAVLADQSRPSS